MELKVTRKQNTNVTQIFQDAVAISYAKMSNMNTLAGANIAGFRKIAKAMKAQGII